MLIERCYLPARLWCGAENVWVDCTFNDCAGVSASAGASIFFSQVQ